MRKGSMMVNCIESPDLDVIVAIRKEALSNQRKHRKLVRTDSRDKHTLRRNCDIVTSNTGTACRKDSYKLYRRKRVTSLTNDEIAQGNKHRLLKMGIIERPVLSREAKRLLAKKLSVK
jgi:hypothetical protein